MVNKTFTFNRKAEVAESISLKPDVQNVSTNQDLLAKGFLDQELYKVDNLSIDLKAAYDTSALVVDTEIDHVDSAQTLLNRHRSLFNGIREKINSNSEDTGLHKRLKAFIEKWKDDPDVLSLLGPYFTKGTGNSITITRDSSLLSVADIKKSTDNDSSALFNLSRFAMDDFHRMSTLRRDFIRLKRAKVLEMRNSLKKQNRLTDEIEDAREAFENSEKTLIEAEENYAIVRKLLEDQLKAVDDAFAERYRILSNPMGLCFVRVSDLPMQISFHQTSLIAEPRAGQLPANCRDAPELPERLQPFLDLLDDQPMSSWRQLKPYWRWLPKEWALKPPLRVIPQIHQSIGLMPPAFHLLMKAVPSVQRRSVVSTSALSLSARSKQSADEITLEQLTKTRHGGLRKKARRLQDDLSTALSCLLQQLQEMPAAARYSWSRLAEKDALNTQNLLSWPGFQEYANRQEGLYLREIVAWLNSQLDGNAITESRSAMRTSIRACLLQAVNDDPEDLLHGKVIQFPGFIKPGVLLTATLNRTPVLSARLKVYDGAQQLIAEARVVDSNETQANIEIISTYVSTPAAFASWTVVGHKALLDAGFD